MAIQDISPWARVSAYGLVLFSKPRQSPLANLVAITRRPVIRRLILVALLPILFFLRIYARLARRLRKRSPISTESIDEKKFSDITELQTILERLGNGPARTTGSKAHEEFISWIEDELKGIPGLEVRRDAYEILRWQTKEGKSLHDAGKLVIDCPEKSKEELPIIGAVPFSLPTQGQRGELVYFPPEATITRENAKGKIVMIDLPAHAIPYSMLFLPSYSTTPDLNEDLMSTWDRPGQADEPLMNALVAAGKAGAAGMIIMFDVDRSQLESYFEPHQGVHYRLPAVFVGIDEALKLKELARSKASATVSIEAEVGAAMTRNVIATLPGQIEERVIFQTHTDGNTFVQENGAAAILPLARYFAKQPLSKRRRTIEFAFNTAHLHISREGTARHATQLDSSFDDQTLALIIPAEHLGTREIEPVPRENGSPGRSLRFSGRGEMMLWSTGPMPAVVDAVEAAVKRRKLDRIVVTRGTAMPDTSSVPTYKSFGGIGTSFYTSPAASSQYGCASSSQTRGFHANPRYQYATKDAQDKDSLKPRSTEYSKSGSDDTAAHNDAAFDPKQTKPETEEKNMGGSSNPTEGNPLSVSPGNPQVSKARDPQEGGAQNATGENRKRTSGAGNPTKHG
ncbi:hypothetical protein FKW77_002669 [Venturia effusa]|uniref:PA domain-containing protein n=1 Tax=Venturia effusa TaxID=50376 RepID=A0A517L8U3_9PEZI|nr:hypothetical protein FKW77_002669 [Venturia effusa]